MRQHPLLERAVREERRAFLNFQDRTGRYETACYIISVQLPNNPKPCFIGVDTHELPGVIGLLESGVTLVGASHYTTKKPGFFESLGYVDVLHTQNRVVRRDISQMGMRALLDERRPMTEPVTLLSTDPADVASLVYDRLTSLYKPELYVSTSPSGMVVSFDPKTLVETTAHHAPADIRIAQYRLSGNRIKTLHLLATDLRRVYPIDDVLTP